MLQTSAIWVKSRGKKRWYKNGCKTKCQICLKLAPDLKIYILTCGGPISWVCERALHTLLLHSTCIHVSLSGFFAAGMRYRLRCYFSLEDKRKNGKKETAGASRPQACSVFTLPDCLSVTCCMSLLPVSVPMTLLLTRAGDPSFIRPNYILWPLTAG